MVLFIFLLGILHAHPTPAAPTVAATLAWDPNAEPDLAGYNIYYGTSSRHYEFVYDAGNRNSCTLSNLEAGRTYCFAATAYDVYGNESDFSEEVCTTSAALNSPPLAEDGALTTTQGTLVSGKLTATDPDENPLTYAIVNQGATGAAVITNANTGAFTYTPHPHTTGTDTFTFKVNDGTVDSNIASVHVTIAPHVRISLEAEQGDLTAPMQEESDPTATAGKYIWVPSGNGNVLDPLQTGGEVLYHFSVPTPGNYLVWGRVMANGTDHNSFFVAMDAGAGIAWNTALGAQDTWVWDPVTSGNTAAPVLFHLEAGTHTLSIKHREDGVKIDSISITTEPKWIPETMYSDAEDMTLPGWDVSDADPDGALITDVYDPDRDSTVIELTGSAMNNGYRLRSGDFTKWANSSQLVLVWSMKYAEDLVISVGVDTTAGFRGIRYKPIDWDELGSDNPVRFGIGSGARDGQWHTFVRDLQADLERAQSGVKILQVNSFWIRGSGRVDDIKLRQSP